MFAFDFSGSGQSTGSYVTWGYEEKDDLQDVMQYLSEKFEISSFCLWGRGMGAAVAVLHAGAMGSGKLKAAPKPTSVSLAPVAALPHTEVGVTSPITRPSSAHSSLLFLLSATFVSIRPKCIAFKIT